MYHTISSDVTIQKFNHDTISQYCELSWYAMIRYCRCWQVSINSWSVVNACMCLLHSVRNFIITITWTSFCSERSAEMPMCDDKIPSRVNKNCFVRRFWLEFTTESPWDMFTVLLKIAFIRKKQSCNVYCSMECMCFFLAPFVGVIISCITIFTIYEFVYRVLYREQLYRDTRLYRVSWHH